MNTSDWPEPTDPTLARLFRKLKKAKTAEVPNLSEVRECERQFIDEIADAVLDEMHRMRIEDLVESVSLDVRYRSRR